MTPENFLLRVVDPALARLATLAAIPVSDQARVLVMAIAGQESGWQHRRQVGGPARSYWQFERMGGVAELFQKTPSQLYRVCASLDIPLDPNVVFEAMAWNDDLGCAMGRLLLWQDPAALPALGEQDVAWNYYFRNWRPGLPHPEVWRVNYQKSLQLVRGNV